MNTANPPNVKFVQTADYREAYANSVQIRVNVWDFFLVFGTMQQNSETHVELRNFQGIYLSPQQAKALMALLQQNVTNYEAAFGEIKLDRALQADRFTEVARLAAHLIMLPSPFPMTAARPGSPSGSKTKPQAPSFSWPQQLLLFALFFAGLMLLHAPLLRLPYFWDEAGYYVPAARDLFLTGSLIPRSTPSNAHPPLVMAWLALAWHIFGYSRS